MARALRIEYDGAHYHVTSRGNERKAVFRDDTDREKFLELIGRAVQFGIQVHSYVLMDNHYHLLIETPRGGLNQALRYLNGVYTHTGLGSGLLILIRLDLMALPLRRVVRTMAQSVKELEG
jgi:REP element-mobilizing transposase RayT